MNAVGTYQASSRAFGFFTPEGAVGKDQDFFVPPRCDGGAWSGDKVAVTIRPDNHDKSKNIAVVTQVLERTNHTVVGKLERRNREIWLLPSSDRMRYPIKVLGSTNGAYSGDRVAVTVTNFGNKMTTPTGTLKEIFGKDGTRKASVEAVLYGQDIFRDFPDEVTKQANSVPETVDAETASTRLDLRGQTVITIDGAASKDFDDAISLEKNADGNWVLGVHIADVSHYVTEGSPLDLEAWDRGTSVYFADQVVPMLPQVLSNGICSLNPQVDRLSLSCFMTMNKDGDLLDHSIAKTVICSTERMTYGDCNILLKDQDPELAERYSNILPMLNDMAGLAKALEKRRNLRGSLNLESQECYLVCDQDGNPVDVRVRVTGQSEKLIESFMLAANECVAEHLQKGKLPGVYRVHENPSEDKITRLKSMLAPLGLELKNPDNFGLQKVLDAAKDSPKGPAIHTMVLRSLMKARYDEENLGHFGLAAEYYCHFTSPIRRYPDLMVHRILTAMLDNAITPALTLQAQKAANQSSQRELAAMTAEREIEKCYMAEFMTPFIGETFVGSISGVTKMGLYVALANGVEGLVALTALPDDRYDFDEVRMTLTAKNSGVSYTFGMALDVICASTNAGSGQIEFHLVGVECAGTASVTTKRSFRNDKKSPAKKGKGMPSYRPPKRRKGGKKR